MLIARARASRDLLPHARRLGVQINFLLSISGTRDFVDLVVKAATFLTADG